MSKKLTTEEFIEKARKVHGDKYDYSKVEYIGSKTKVKIICPIHGEFEQIPNSHLMGRGCVVCANVNVGKRLKLTTATFIEKARKVHGNKYDYSKVEYINTYTKVKIICPIHGEFEQTPHDHLVSECVKCGHEKTASHKRLSQEEFIEKAKQVHGDKYDYSKVEYVNNRTKVCIICPIHGEFWQMPNNHLLGQECYLCGCGKISKTKRKYTTETYKEAIRKVHGEKYILDKVEYNGFFNTHIITCPIHGDFKTHPSNLLSGHGCAQCAFERNRQKRLHDIEWFLEKSVKVHGQRYDYSEVVYRGMNIKVKIACKKCGNVFEQTPYNHITCRHGCPKCNRSHLESEIEVLLSANNIDYKKEYFLQKLRGDFYLPNYNIVIECQGEQHFIPKFVSCKDKEKQQQLFQEGIERDNRKKRICDEQGIVLLYYTRPQFLKDHVWEMGIYNKENTFSNLEDLLEKIRSYEK